MLPQEYRTLRGEELERKVEALPNGFADLEPLQPPDYQLIGAFIQVFNFIEFNLRRSLEIHARAELLEPSIARRHSRIRQADIVKQAKAAVSRMDSMVEDIPATRGKLNEIEFRRAFRNLLAHWAARRIPGEDAILLLSKDGSDDKQISGEETVGHDHAKNAIVDLADLRGLLAHIISYENWMAAKTSEWHRRYIGDPSAPQRSPKS